MDKPDLGKYHDLINRLSIVVGYCDLLEHEMLESRVRQKHLHYIREFAKAMAEDLKRHQYQIDATVREAVKKKATSASK